MTHLVERLVELDRHLRHLRDLRARVTGPEALAADLTLHNDALFSLLMVCQAIIDISGELSARRGDRFEDYTASIRNLSRDERFPPDLVKRLERLPGFRNVVVHEYVGLDLERAVEAIRNLEALEEFLQIVRRIEGASS